MAVLERIKFDGNTHNEPWILYKCREENIALGSQLIVGMGQEAVFIKGGQAQDIFTPGTYTLESGNLPFLRKLVSMPFGGRTPFTAEVVFVNKTDNLNLKWGTASPVTFEDPKYGLLLDLRSFGTFGVKIFDSRLFLNRFIGSMQLDSGFNHDFIIHQFLAMINTRYKSLLMQFLQERKLSYFELPACYEEISTRVRAELVDDFSAYGIDLLNLFVESITPPKEQYARLRQYKEELSLGPDFYAKRRSFDVLEEAANSPAGGMAGAGMGFGAGLYAAPMVAAPVDQLVSHINISDGIQVRQNRTCPNCHSTVSADSRFCPRCGTQMDTETRCPACGKPVGRNDAFCPACGKPLRAVCSNCGAELEPGARFCSKCGKRCS